MENENPRRTEMLFIGKYQQLQSIKLLETYLDHVKNYTFWCLYIVWFYHKCADLWIVDTNGTQHVSAGMTWPNLVINQSKTDKVSPQRCISRTHTPRHIHFQKHHRGTTIRTWTRTKQGDKSRGTWHVVMRVFFFSFSDKGVDLKNKVNSQAFCVALESWKAATQKNFQDPSPLAAGEMLDLSHSQVEWKWTNIDSKLLVF